MKMIQVFGFTVLLLCGIYSPLLAEEELAPSEQQAMADTLQYALESNKTGQSADWVNPDTGRSGAVVPVRTFDNTQGQPCREFQSTIIIAGQEEQGYGTACRQPDGSWELVTDTSQSARPVPPPTTVDYANAPPPPVYYRYPAGFFGSYGIYLSFNHVFRSGRIHYGLRYLDGPTFRHRHPIRVRERVYLGPQVLIRHRLHDEWRYRDWDRHRHDYDRRYDSHRKSRKYDDRRDRRDDRDRDRGRRHD